MNRFWRESCEADDATLVVAESLEALDTTDGAQLTALAPVPWAGKMEASVEPSSKENNQPRLGQETE